VPACQIGRLILVGDLETSPSQLGSTVIYARVSSTDQRADLDRQVSRECLGYGSGSCDVTAS
jgi:predicted site-specific integrase-resolvase